MRIAIDASSVPQQPAGAGVYAIELARALTAMPARDGYVIFTRGDWLDDCARERHNWRIERVRTGSRAARLAWEQATLPRRLDALGIDVLHSTHHTLPLRPMRARRVVTVHDVTFLRMPDRYPPARRLYMQTLTRLAARVADAIVVPSRAVRDDVVRLLRVPESKLSVVYEAPPSRLADPDAAARTGEVLARYGVRAPYVLSVGSLEPGKNRPRLIEAMAQLRDERLDLSLVLVGQCAWRYEPDFEAVKRFGMTDGVAFLGYVPDADLAALYASATAVAFPSLYEGFGLPVLEGMAAGVPVLTSNVSATAEVAGDAALLVDPRSVAAIRDGLRRILTDADLRADLAARGIERAAQFSWQRAAQETYDVYRRVYEQGRPQS